MQIRKALQEDLLSINDIYNQAVHQKFCTAHLKPVSIEYQAEWFDAHDPRKFPVFVAESEEGTINGWISLSAYRPDREAFAQVAEVSYYVHQKCRRRGTGSRLMQHVIRIAPDYGIYVLIAILLDRNTASIALLNRFGFSKWGTMPGIARIGHETADHLYYGLKLSAGSEEA